MSVIERRFDLTFDKEGKPSHIDGPTCPEYKQHGGFPKSIEVVPAEQLQGAVEAFAQERQAVLDVVNIYGDETLHKALDNIGWPANYLGGQ